MKLGKVLPVVLSLGLMLPFAGPAHAAEEPVVKVELTAPFALSSTEALTTMTFTVNGNYTVEGQPSFILIAGQKYFVQLENGALSLYRFGQMGMPVPLVQGVSTLTLTPSLPDGEAATLKVEGKTEYSYRGGLELRVGYKGTIQRIIPINIVGMENYLKGVVPSEMYTSWNREALKAQAVAARTYAVRKLNTQPGGYINDTVQYQVYKGVTNENQNSNLAVEETKGEVLSYNGSLIDAVYSSSNGGYTEAAENVWKGSGVPYLTAKPDPYDAASGTKDRSWQQTLTLAQLQDKIKNRTPAVGTIKKIEVKQTYPSGRVADLAIEGDKGELHLSKDEARTVLGLRSARYTVQANYSTPTPASVKELLAINSDVTTARKEAGGLVIASSTTTKASTGANLVIQGAEQKKAVSQSGNGTASQPVLTSVTFNGSGYGHGVGMSQWGAQQMAKEGKTYRDILDFYYAPAQITGEYGTQN